MSKKQEKAERYAPPEQPPAVPKIPARWGTSEAKWFADREGQIVVVSLRSGGATEGILVGHDQFSFFLEHANGNIEIVFKHAVDTAL